MDAIIKKLSRDGAEHRDHPPKRPSMEEAQAAVRTLLAWAGDDPAREGLLDTPKRVANAFREYFSGYEEDPAETLSRTFEEVGGYDDIVMLRDIEFNSHCEHHIAPFVGRAHVAYLPTRAVVGISKLARVVDIFARRLQTQETMTSQIVHCINEALEPRGAAVMLEAVHTCMSMRGIGKRNVATITTMFVGEFKSNPVLQARFMELVRAPQAGFSLSSQANLDETLEFRPRFDAQGLITAVVTDAADGTLLMVAMMNAEALRLTLATGEAHFWSRSRARLWRKGETSGETLKVSDVLTDCDQDCLQLKVIPQGRGAACHTGRRTCFYRRLANGRLEPTGAEPLFDPATVYPFPSP